MKPDHLWYEQICLPCSRRQTLRHPWRYRGQTLVTNGALALLLPTEREYPDIDKESAAMLDDYMTPAAPPRKTTVAALRDWAGSYTFKRCQKCQGAGWVSCPDCTDGCYRCDDEKEVECPACKTACWEGFDCESHGSLSALVINLKQIAGIVNCVPDGDVNAHIPEQSRENPKPLLLIGKRWKATLMPLRINTGKPFYGWQ